MRFRRYDAFMRKILTVLYALAFFLLTFATPSCAWMKKEGQIALDCGKLVATQNGLDLLEEVAGLLAGGGANWESALVGIAEKVGWSAVNCMVDRSQAAVAGSALPQRLAHLAPHGLKIRKRAEIWKAHHGGKR